ncbi:hypothetical protein FOA43_000161 [Brettanomyces nanus]|uniref:Uncharacterized protein n=1 Tax=Eeniella nana TaxID=13502 RepID=A0A875RYV7_EENNA|nr:uncharacterized protein FOA43_000161 [Brettanomyces nanus]QPG72859.1 hypothetical protein FOA43_000161 [Brettanomyces nanus]
MSDKRARSRLEPLSRTATTTSSMAPVHPMELAVQSLLESPLELLSLNLNSLYESQVILSTILKRLESKLNECLKNIEGGDEKVNEDSSSITTDHSDDTVNLDTYSERIHKLRQTVEKISMKLEIVEKRIDKITNNMK